jgi:polar amino acid transport system substrate-binding protein
MLTEENPPLNFSEQGRVSGVATAVVTEMARRAGVPAEFRVTSWNEAFARARESAKACVYSTVRTKARFEQFQWIGPIARGEYSAYGLSEFADQPKTVEDLKHYRIGVVNDARAEYLRQRGFQRLFTFDNNTEIPKYLTAGGKDPRGMDLWVTHSSSATQIAERAGIRNLKLVFSAILNQDYWLACGRKVPTAVVTALSDALSSMLQDGSARKLQTSIP